MKFLQLNRFNKDNYNVSGRKKVIFEVQMNQEEVETIFTALQDGIDKCKGYNHAKRTIQAALLLEDLVEKVTRENNIAVKNYNLNKLKEE